MKPLIYLSSMMIILMSVNVFANCNRNSGIPDSCYRPREMQTKVRYREPVIYCAYHDDKKGVTYTVCHDCDKYKCVKTYYYDNYCEQHDCQ